MWQRLFDGPVNVSGVLIALVPALLIAWLLARMVRRLLARGLETMLRDSVARSSPLVRGPLRLVGAVVFVLALGIIAVPLLELAGLRPRGGVRLRELTTWTFTSGLRVILIAAFAFIIVRVVTLLVRRFEHEMNVGTSLDALERAKRARTLGSLIKNVAAAVVSIVAVLMILNELGINIAPVLAGAGIVGLAVGFGAQTLVRDIISGFFLILEDQVRVGDVAAINGQGGLVEAINLRTIVLRDFEGTVHVFPNGGITTLANRSKDFSFYVIDLGVAYEEDSDRVVGVLLEVGTGLQADDKFGPSILAPLEVVGVDAFADSSVMIKLRIKTVPLKQWEVGRELRRRILRAFRQHGIEIPFPQRVMRVEQASSPRDLPPPASAPETAARS